MIYVHSSQYLLTRKDKGRHRGGICSSAASFLQRMPSSVEDPEVPSSFIQAEDGLNTLIGIRSMAEAGFDRAHIFNCPSFAVLSWVK